MKFVKKVAKESEGYNRCMSKNVMKYYKRDVDYGKGQNEWTKYECNHIEKATEKFNGVWK